MSHYARSKKFRPMNVQVRPRSSAERLFCAKAALPKPEEIVPGIQPSPDHNLIFQGGKTIQNLVFTNSYLGGKDAWDPAAIQSIDDSLSKAMADQNLNNVMMQYFNNQQITSVFQGSSVRAGQPPNVVSKGDVESLVTTLQAAGNFDGFDLGSTVFNFLLPRGAILNADPVPTGAVLDPQAFRKADKRSLTPTTDEGDSRNGLGGYHGSVHVNASGQDLVIYYAIGVFSEVQANGTQNGIPVFDEAWKNVVATFYHELNEARTDPDVEDAIRAGNDPVAVNFLGWTSQQGEECGDFPVFEANPLTDVFQEVLLTDGSAIVPIQFQYSNAVEGPEGPIADPHRMAKRARR